MQCCDVYLPLILRTVVCFCDLCLAVARQSATEIAHVSQSDQTVFVDQYFQSTDVIKGPFCTFSAHLNYNRYALEIRCVYSHNILLYSTLPMGRMIARITQCPKSDISCFSSSLHLDCRWICL